MAGGSRPKRKPRHDQFDEVVPSRLEFQQPMGREMQVSADWAGDWLRLVMIVKAREIAPAGVPTQFDQTGTNHDPKTEPTKKPNDQNWRPVLRERPPVEQWTQED